MIALHTQKDVGIDGQVLCARVPLVAQVGKVGQGASLLVLELLVDVAPLAGVLAGFGHIIVVFQARIAVQSRVDPGQMIAFAVVLDGQLPVAGDIELQRRARTTVMQRLIELLPAFDQVGVDLLERRCSAIDVDEDYIAPDMGADAEQAEFFGPDGLVAVLPGAAYVGCRPQFAVEAVTPAVVGAADDAADLARPVDQDHAAVTTGVLEDVDGPVARAHHQERHAQKTHRPGVADGGYILADADALHVGEEYGALLFKKKGRIDVVPVGQATGTGDRLHDAGKKAKLFHANLLLRKLQISYGASGGAGSMR